MNTFLKATLAAALGGAASGALEALNGGSDMKHVGRSAIAGALVVLIAYFKKPPEKPAKATAEERSKDDGTTE